MKIRCYQNIYFYQNKFYNYSSTTQVLLTQYFQNELPAYKSCKLWEIVFYFIKFTI